MTSHVGVDWASRGWLAVGTDGQEWTARMHPSIHSVWFEHRDADAILVDVPIGLPADHRRTCDREAKDFLGPDRANSVFWTPCRAAVEATTYEQAKEANQMRRGDSLSSQAWGLIPRIQEVDRLLRDAETARQTILESHPDVCFTALSGGDPLSPKQSAAGETERIACLEEVDDAVRPAYDRFVSTYIEEQEPWARRIGASNRDDLLDAMVLALTATLADGEFETLPADPPTDQEGLPMQIIYAEA
ncbi:hypothetical protein CHINAEXTREME_11530 [Halobiforma lacisalsi AJ5]|uniref:DUF429 domain-containing protein n=1 Tax=Natronobacterium lacisalsi AJ5 TaxID=358396 RepID=M0L6B7_NATLA|nr:DUF429 domain-containing protein [Halobiforma lacisalsi]APW98378.1 hypothetical protein CHINAEXTREME_11530 [Halobiforma lacisalsi AJ5]EMA27984.1 hypothetical protein C445_20082 [Halobiforma lacisalsi AJ5]